MAFTARYSDVAQLIAAAHSVPPERLTALRGRLQHFQKLRFPPGVNTGRGKPAEYGAEQVLLIVLALEFVAMGITPDRATRVLREKEPNVAAAAHLALDERRKDEPEPIFIRLEPAALFDEDPGFGYATASSIERFLRVSTHLTGFTRHALVNLSTIIDHIAEWAAGRSPKGEDDFTSALREWAVVREGGL